MTTALQSVPIDTIVGEPTSLAEYSGQVLLVVNVASKCGLTPQYEGLEALYERYGDQGLVVLGFPYAVKFPIFAKIAVTGPDKHPLYQLLTDAVPHASGDPEAHRERLRSFHIPANEDPDILWNFEKFLIGRDGTVLARFAPNLVPEDPALVAAIEGALAS